MLRGLESHWWLVLIVVILLFGAKRLPDAARSLGRSMRVFKSEVDEMKKDGKDAGDASQSTVKGETVQTPTPPTAESASDPKSTDKLS